MCSRGSSWRLASGSWYSVAQGRSTPGSCATSPESRAASGTGSGCSAPPLRWCTGRPCSSSLAALPAQLAEAVIVDAEVVPDLVDHRPADLLDDVFLGVADRADGLLVDRDPVRQHAGVVGGPAGQRDSFIEAEQATRTGAGLDQDGHVLDQGGELRG